MIYIHTCTCYIKQKDEQFTAFAEYHSTEIGEDGILARHLCHYLIKDGKQYQLLYNEMEENREILIYEYQGSAECFHDELFNSNKGVLIEFRRLLAAGDTELLSHLIVPHHMDVVRYLLKDYIHIAELGHFEVDSTEIDEDRGVYVIYVV